MSPSTDDLDQVSNSPGSLSTLCAHHSVQKPLMTTKVYERNNRVEGWRHNLDNMATSDPIEGSQVRLHFFLSTSVYNL